MTEPLYMYHDKLLKRLELVSIETSPVFSKVVNRPDNLLDFRTVKFSSKEVMREKYVLNFIS